MTKILDNYEPLIALCCHESHRRQTWNNLLNLCEQGYDLVSKKEDFAQEDLNNFRSISYDLMVKCYSFADRNGMTNYVCGDQDTCTIS